MKMKYLALSALIMVAVFNACVEDNIYNGPATIESVVADKAAPKSSETVLVTAKILDLKGITSADLKYRTSATGSFTSIAMTTAEKFMYSAVIPIQPMNTKVEYYIDVKNEGGFSTVYPAGAPAKLASYTVGASTLIKLFVNEAFADGTKDTTDPDWVEIYNDSDIPVDISGYAFYDEGIKTSAGTKPKRIINNGTIIPSKGFLVLKTELTGGEYAVEFGLSTSGDAAYLENKDGVVVSSLDFNSISLAGKKSYGRKPDGSSNLVIFTNATRGTSNNNAQ